MMQILKGIEPYAEQPDWLKQCPDLSVITTTKTFKPNIFRCILRCYVNLSQNKYIILYYY